MRTRIGLLVVLATLTGACAAAHAGPAPFVDLSDRLPLPAEGTGEARPLRIGVGAILSPEGTIESYEALADYIEVQLDREVEIVQRRTYQEVNDLLERGDVDVAFVCTSAYVAGHDEFGLELLAAPEIDGDTVYYSTLIVPADSTAQSMVDLRGSTFAFTDPISTTGRIYPTYLLLELGEDPNSFFGSTFFTYSHDRAIEAVAERFADGAAVDSLVLEHALARDPELAGKVRVIHRSPAFAIPPAVVSPETSAVQAAELRSLLLGIDADAEAAQALADLGVTRFVPIDDDAYDNVRAVIAAVEQNR